jgi:hypothetical protein
MKQDAVSPAGSKKDKKKVSFLGKADKKTKPSPDDKDDEEPENPSSLLTLTILDSDDSNEVNLNYYRDKDAKAAYEGVLGSYSDRDSNEDKNKKTKGKKDKKK